MNKPVAKRKPKPPPYPRPIPHFVVEELPPTPSDIAWNILNGGGYYSQDEKETDDEAQVERRAAKRRRIEKCAAACLRGEPLYLMSAQLRGPFNNGWKNPWSKRVKPLRVDQKEKAKNIEIPETAKRTIHNIDEAAAGKIPNTTLHPRPLSRQSPSTDVSLISPARDVAPSPFTSRIPRMSNIISPKLPKKVQEKRVEEWLRVNDTLPKPSNVLVHSSPTPSSSRRKTPGHQNEQRTKSRESQSEPPKTSLPVVDASRIVVSVSESGLFDSSRTERRIQKLSRDMQNMIAEPAVQTARDLQDEVRRLAIPASSSKSVLDSSRAEFAILRAKQNILQTAPADAHMSPFEFRKVATASEAQVKHRLEPAIGATIRSEVAPKNLVPQTKSTGDSEDLPIALVEESASRATETSGKAADEIFMTAPQVLMQQNVVESSEQIPLEDTRCEELAATSTSNQPLSTAVSDTNVTDVPPSAQAGLVFEAPLSNDVLDERLLSMKRVPSTVENPAPTEAAGKGQEEDAVALIAPGVFAGNETTLNQTKSMSENPNAFTPVPVRVATDISTQEMLANIEPLEMSTIKKLRSSPKVITPLTATKRVPDKKRKKTSFAAEPHSASSYGSIRDVMNAKVSKRLGSPPLFLLGKADLDLDVSDEENESQRKRPRPTSSAGKPKGILKSTNLSSSPNSLRKSKQGYSTGQEQDGEQRMLPPGSGQNGIEKDNFDLDAAIDDLGSFLGTWDAEKEASSLDIEA